MPLCSHAVKPIHSPPVLPSKRTGNHVGNGWYNSWQSLVQTMAEVVHYRGRNQVLCALDPFGASIYKILEILKMYKNEKLK